MRTPVQKVSSRHTAALNLKVLKYKSVPLRHAPEQGQRSVERNFRRMNNL
jgi:hypothetical protein